MNAILAALGSIIAPLEEAIAAKLVSVGSAFLSAMGIVFNGFTADQRTIGVNVTAYWQAKYHAAIAAGTDPFLAIEQASTASLNEFFNEEAKELSKVVSLTVSALEVSVANSLKV